VQNVHWEASGAFTGETSAGMAADAGAELVLVGHSERRWVFGETLAERDTGKVEVVLAKQLRGSLAGLTPDQLANIILAYEPVWAIGTGKVATTAQAEEVHADLRSLLAKRYNEAVAAEVRILYGGSVKASNAGELLGQPNIDGALVGGASLKVDEFLGIAKGV